jgi:methylenetetrahydrofolate--tRNA-(uracil-5-)-methyltransferase
MRHRFRVNSSRPHVKPSNESWKLYKGGYVTLKPQVGVIGAGLAGSDCAWILAERHGIAVHLYEMKPSQLTPAQHLPNIFAELVCSNSLKSMSPLNPAGLLKEEMRSLGSLVLSAASDAQVPAGESLAVDREVFGELITRALKQHPLITVKSECVHSAALLAERDGLDAVIVATGPLTEGGLNAELSALAASGSGQGAAPSLYFYDAIAPILDGDSLDRSVLFMGNRITRSGNQTQATRAQSGVDDQASGDTGDYLNIPLTREEYTAFVAEVRNGAKVPHHSFEEPRYFNGCQPIENLAESGPLTLAHGPMKGRGLTDPRTGRWPFAAVQLRKEKLGDASFNMVGFQTRLTWPEQKRIFRMLPGLTQAEFHRMGSMHRNTYLCAPRLLGPDFRLKSEPRVALAGQIMGVEGYLESAAMGCFIGHTIARQLKSGTLLPPPPATTALGSLCQHVLKADPDQYAPMNVNWGLIDPLDPADVPAIAKKIGLNQTLPAQRRDGTLRIDKGTKRQLLSHRARQSFQAWLLKEVAGIESHIQVDTRIGDQI